MSRRLPRYTFSRERISNLTYILTAFQNTQDILKRAIEFQIEKKELAPSTLLERFLFTMDTALRTAAADGEVAGFKSVACYRTGLDIGIVSSITDDAQAHQLLTRLSLIYMTNQMLRLAHKPINDYIVNATMRIAGEAGKPGMLPPMCYAVPEGQG